MALNFPNSPTKEGGHDYPFLSPVPEATKSIHVAGRYPDFGCFPFYWDGDSTPSQGTLTPVAGPEQLGRLETPQPLLFRGKRRIHTGFPFNLRSAGTT